MLYLTSLEKIVFHWLKTTIPAGRVVGWSGGRVRWLDNLEMLINSVQLSWSLTELAISQLLQTKFGPNFNVKEKARSR